MNLGSAYQELGDLYRAVRQFTRALLDMPRVLGMDHPHTLMCMSNDGHAWLAKGDRHTAAQMFESVLAGCLRTYGEDHRYTSDARRNLAATER